jgi:putative addiction module CopG family antidote
MEGADRHAYAKYISLTPEQDAFVDSIVKTGEYQNASEAVRDAFAHSSKGGGKTR